MRRRRGLKFAMWNVALAAIIAVGARQGAAAEETSATAKPFTIIALPDTQNYCTSRPEIFKMQTEWIKDQKDELNILCVVHEGDVTNNNNEREWRHAEEAMRVLDGEAPYCIALGNHDLGKSGSTNTRDTLFHTYFPVSRFSDKPWYGGHYGEGMENAYYLFEADGMKLLVICLEFGPRDEVLEWANEIVAKNSDRRVIVVTHCYMYSDDTRVWVGDKWNPHDYKNVQTNDGEEIWTKFARKHPNVFLVLSGHILNDGIGRQTSMGDHANKVHEVLANYQMHENSGNGWLRIMQFDPGAKKIRVKTYSPYLGRYAEDDQNQFELEWEMK